MKKLLLLLLLAPVVGFGQVLTDVLYLSGYNVNPTYTDTGSANLSYSTHSTPRGSISNIDNLEERVTIYTVPQGKLWEIKYTSRARGTTVDGVYTNQSTFETYNFNLVIDSPELGFFDKSINNQSTERFNQIQFPTIYDGTSYTEKFLKGGTKFWFAYNGAYLAVVYEYSLDGNSLSYNEPEAIKNNSNAPVLFPNPTSSLLALNSDKEYDIEVYDMAGNKVMALKGNTIDMSHLSSATYIVKALDKAQNEEVSYKVVKN